MLISCKSPLKLGYQNAFFQKRFYKEIFPCSKKKIFLPNPNKQRLQINKPPKVPGFEITLGPRNNKIGIQMLSKGIYDQVFTETYKDFSEDEIIQQCKQELEKHEMVTKTEDFLKDVDFRIPPLKGNNIEEHFKIIGEEQVKPYKELLVKLLKTTIVLPKKWEMNVGWTRYVPGHEPESVPYPLEEAIVFDVEVN